MRTQIWIAISVYVLVAVIKKQLDVKRSLGEILQILSITLFEKTPVWEAFSMRIDQKEDSSAHNQLSLFNF